MKTFYLIDASIYIFRAWFSMDESITDAQGRPVNAVYGFAHFLAQLLERAQPEYIVAAFDESLSSSFRNKIYPQYKANREPAPEELKHQFQLCRKLCRAIGIQDVASKRYEADDLIGSLADRFRKKKNRIIIVSRDKDLLQLIEGHDQLWDFADDKFIDSEQAEQLFGVRPEQMVDYLALAGDAVDNIPGVKGVGKKTAVQLLQYFGSLENIYARLDEVDTLDMRGAKRVKTLLSEHQEMAWISQQLTQIKRDIKLSLSQQDSLWQFDLKKVERYFNRLGTGQRLLARFSKLVD